MDGSTRKTLIDPAAGPCGGSAEPSRPASQAMESRTHFAISSIGRVPE